MIEALGVGLEVPYEHQGARVQVFYPFIKDPIPDPACPAVFCSPMTIIAKLCRSYFMTELKVPKVFF